MNYMQIFNAVADGSPALPKLIEASVRELNAAKPFAIAEAELAYILKTYTATTQKTKDTAAIEIDVEEMDRGAKFRGQFQDRLGRLFEGLAERQNVFEGRKITLSIKPPAAPKP